MYGEKGKFTKAVIGYGANSLCLCCPGDVMPCGKDTLVENEKWFDQKRIAKFSKDVLKGKVFGFAQLDIELPDERYDKFSEIATLFLVQEIPDCDIPEKMKIYKEKTCRKTVKWKKRFLGVMKAKKILFYTPLIKWYFPHGLRLTAVYYLIEYESGNPFSWFPGEVTNARHEADNDLHYEEHNDLHFQPYKDALDVFLKTKRDSELEGKDIDKAKNVGFRVYDQGIVTYEQNKLGLSAYYDKHYILTDGIHTRPLDF